MQCKHKADINRFNTQNTPKRKLNKTNPTIAPAKIELDETPVENNS